MTRAFASALCLGLLWHSGAMAAVDASVAAPGTSGTSLWGSVVATMLALVFVLGLAWLSLWAFKRLQSGRGTASNEGPRIVRSVSLGPRERLVVVQHHDAELLLGVTPGAISLLERRVNGGVRLADRAPPSENPSP
jgi:flagellar biosynthetic protein FliO